MDNLPYELIEMILEKLEIKDLVKLRLVNKKFEDIVDSIKIDQLVFQDRFHFIDKWSNSKLQLSNKNMFVFGCIQYRKIKPILNSSLNLTRLKRLKITSYQFKDQSLINKFSNLIHLEIGYLINGFKLELENLKILKLWKIKDLEINCIKLEFFSCLSEFENIKFNQIPESIRYLEINDIKSDFILKLNNLETLVILYYIILDGPILNKLLKLKEIHFLKSFFSFTLIEKLLNERKNSNSNSLKIYYKNNLIDNQNDLIQL